MVQFEILRRATPQNDLDAPRCHPERSAGSVFSPADGITARWRISFDKVLNDYQISFAANVLLFVLPVLTTEHPLVKLRVLE